MSNNITTHLPDIATVQTGPGIYRHAPWLVLVASLLLTYMYWQSNQRNAVQKLQIEFDSRTSDVSDRMRRRIEYYEQMLHGVRSFYANQKIMEPHEFRGYIAALGIDRNFPGIQGVSFAHFVDDGAKAAHIRSMRQLYYPGYAIKPEGRRPLYAPVSMIEPLDERNMRVLGFDNLSNPIRRALIERARDEDRAIISEKLVLKQEDANSQQAGFLMFLPVYHRGAAHDTIEERHANIAGWFAASFRMNDLLAKALDERALGINIEIFDGESAVEEARMYGSDSAANGHVPRYMANSVMEISGHRWLLRFSSRPEFEAKLDSERSHETAAGGVMLSVLLSLLVWMLVRGRKLAIENARAITRELEMRKQMEGKLRDLYELNESILEESPAGIAVFSASGQCVMANASYAKTIGGTVEQVLAGNFRHESSWQQSGRLDAANQALETGQVVQRDFEGQTLFGKRVALECIFSPIGIAGKPHLLVIVNDVSERAEARRALTESIQQLEEKELAKTRFLAAAGHDLRQPLAAANLFIDALKLTERTDRQNDIIHRLDQAMATFKSLLNALLDVSKLDAGIVKPEYSPIDFAEIFNWLEQNFAQMADEKHLDFRLWFPLSGKLAIYSDLGLLKSVLMNLVLNAIKFTKQGKVLVSARLRGTSILFQVWDTGPGIAEEHIGNIFKEFYQVGNSHRDRTMGLGLGLSIVRRALILLGSDIRCRTKVGHGSVFEFTLPLCERVNRNAVVPSMGTAGEAFLSGKRFIILEDDALVAHAMIDYLEGVGGEVRHFHNAEEALRNAHIENADFFIVDYMLSGTLNGIQFLNRIREKRGDRICAVLMTGDTSVHFIQNSADCTWPVLHKPLNISCLASALEEQARMLEQT